jgi:UDP-N-acetylmuramoyl-tripeptide--D-alanyl-D-alanine ligase
MKRTLANFAACCGGELRGADRDFAQVLIDSRRIGAGDIFCALPGTRTDGHEFIAQAAAAGAAAALVSRVVPLASSASLAQILVADVAGALVQAARAWRGEFHGPVIGVAGSNGKTTTKEMLAAILSQRGACLATLGNLNNQLGVPLTLLRLTAQHQSAVIEIGANRAGEVAELAIIAAPGVGLITNAGAEHLEGFGSLEGVARAEGEMVAALKPEGVAIINDDDPYAPLWRGMTRARVLSFGLSAHADVRATGLELKSDEHGFLTRFTLCSATGKVPVELALAGRHNVYNALAAAAAAVAAGATLAQVAAGLASMRAVPGRLQFRSTRHGAWLIDDSYNANPSSVRAALQVLAELPGRRWLVLGDMAQLGEHTADSHREVGTLARAAGVERLYTFGADAALAADTFGVDADRHTDIDQLAVAVDTALQADVRLLIKGSRVNRLERLVAKLTDAPPARRVG